MAVAKPHDALALWYTPSTAPTNLFDTAAAAYVDAVQYFERELTNDEQKREWARSQSSMADMCHVIEQAKLVYDQGSGKRKKAREWLNAFASRVTYYGSVLDVLVQYDPGHAGLAWGAMKFVFSGVLNHVELVTELSKALTRIADVLPRVQLDGMLYDIPYMRSAISKLYAHIILFLQKAVRWYTRHPALRIASSIFHPFKLSYQDTIDQIVVCAESVTAIATSAVRAETRGLTNEIERQADRLREADVQLCAMQQQMQQIQASSQRAEAHSVQILQLATDHFDLSRAIKLDVTDSKVRICDLQFSQILSHLCSQRDPEDVLQTCRSVAKRRHLWRSPGRDSASFVQRLGDWVSMLGSSILVVVAGPRAEARTKDLAVEVTGLLQATNFPVVWYFSEPIHSDRATSLVKIIKSLLFQAFRKNADIVSQEPSLANAAKYQVEHNLEEWISLLCLVYSKIPKCFIVIETEDLYHISGRDTTVTRQILHTFQRIVDGVTSAGGLLKLLIVSYGRGATLFTSPSAVPQLVAMIGQTLPASRRQKQNFGRGSVLKSARHRWQPRLMSARQVNISSL